MRELEVEYVPIDEISPYENNAREHPEESVEEIAESIRAFGFDDPIGVWSKDNIIVEGHGRLMAAKMLGMERVPVIRLDHLTNEERRAYTLAHNKTQEASRWNDDVLRAELSNIFSIDMGAFDFSIDGIDVEIQPEIQCRDIRESRRTFFLISCQDEDLGKVRELLSGLSGGV